MTGSPQPQEEGATGLLAQIAALQREQEAFQAEIARLNAEILRLTGLVEAEPARFQEALDQQRTRLLTEILDIFS